MATVDITFQGHDKTTTVSKDISKEIVGLEKTAQRSGSKIGSFLGSALSVFTGGALLSAATAATGALTGFFSDGFADARGAALLLGQTEAVIRSTGGAAGVSAEHVTDLASALSDASGKSLFGDDMIQESTNLLLTFTNLKGATLDAATAMSVDMAQALGGAPRDSAIQLGKALNDPINGITALTRVGVTFTEEQKKQIQVLQESGDMAGAQAVILAELNKEFGGSAEAAAAAAGPMAQFKGQMGEVAETVMASLLPAFNDLGAWLTSPAVTAAIQQIATVLADALGAAIVWLGDVALPALLAAFQAVWPAIQSAVAAVYQFLSGVVWPWLQNTAFPWLQNTALPALQRAFEVVWPLIQAAVNAVYQFLSTVVWPWLQNTAFPWLQNVALPALQTAFQTAWSAIKTAVTTTYTFLRDTVWPWLQTAMTNIGTWINTAKNTWSTAWSAISGAVTTAKNTISGVIETIKSIIQGAIDKVNALIRLINSIPVVPNIPTIPSIGGGGGTGGGGGSGFGGRSFAGGSLTTQSTTNATTVYVDARQAVDPRAVGVSVQRAVDQLGLRTDIRLRTT